MVRRAIPVEGSSADKGQQQTDKCHAHSPEPRPTRERDRNGKYEEEERGILGRPEPEHQVADPTPQAAR